MPNNLTLALGSMQATPLEVATGFAVFANGGYRVEPYYIDRIEGPRGEVVYSRRRRAPCARSARKPIYAVSDAEQRQADRSQRHARAADAAARERSPRPSLPNASISPQKSAS